MSARNPDAARKRVWVDPEVEARLRAMQPGPLNTTNLASRWTRACWWLSRRLGGRKVFGKWDQT